MKFNFVGYSPDEVMKKITSIVLDLVGAKDHQMGRLTLKNKYDLFKYDKNDAEFQFSPLFYLKDKKIIEIDGEMVKLIPTNSDQIPEELISLMAYYGDNDGNEYSEIELIDLIDDLFIGNTPKEEQRDDLPVKEFTDTMELAYPAITRWHSCIDEPNLGTLVLLHIRNNMNCIVDDPMRHVVEGKVVMGYFDLFQWKVYPDDAISQLMDNPAVPTMEWRSKAVNLDTFRFSVEHWDYADIPDVETLRYVNKITTAHNKLNEILTTALITDINKPYTKVDALVTIDTLLVKLNELQDDVSHIELPMYDLNTRMNGRYLEAQYNEFLGDKGE